MATTMTQPGEVIDYTAGADITSNDVVVIGSNGDALIGVAITDIANGSTGAVGITGVWELPKVSTAVIAQGESLVWDSSAGAFDDNQATPASGDVSGAAAVAFASAGNGTTTVQVKLTGIPGTLA